MKYERFTKRNWRNDKHTSAYERLAELEDKIEQGTLIDTEAHFIKEDEEWGSKHKYLVCKHYVETYIEEFCQTKAEAEVKLKELEESKK